MNLDFYKELIIEHYKNPKNRQKLAHANIGNLILNPSCGDQIECQVELANESVKKIYFGGQGCVLSQAAASILSEDLLTKTISEIKKLDDIYIKSILKMDIGPVRMKCAALALECLKLAIEDYVKKS